MKKKDYLIRNKGRKRKHLNCSVDVIEEKVPFNNGIDKGMENNIKTGKSEKKGKTKQKGTINIRYVNKE